MIPVFEPVIGPEEVQAVVGALERGEISGTFGQTIGKFEREFASYCGCKYGVAVSSGTAALHLAVAAAGIGPGDKVLISASTIISTALAVAHNGATPVPVDAEEITWNLDLDLLEAQCTAKTRAVIPVHLYGHPVDMDRLMKIAAKHNLTVIEDGAEAHGATCRGRKIGSFGDLACFSFYANKVITTGEGGMVVTNNGQLAQRLRLLRNLAFTQPRFRHELAGYNYRITGFQAAMGLAQLPKIEKIIAEKRRVAETYNHYLADLPGIQLPVERDWARNIYWMYAIVVRPEFGISRDALMELLRRDGIDTRTFFCPMNLQPCLQSLPDFPRVPSPVADRLWMTGLCLPSTHTLAQEPIKKIVDSIRRAAERNSTSRNWRSCMLTDFVKTSYQAHELHYAKFAIGGTKESQRECWMRNDTIDAWRHQRMYQAIDPLLLSYPNSSWLTVGDGRYGTDAHYIQTKGNKVLATDISDYLLKEAHDLGFISEYQKQNAEALSIPSNSFDFIFCKESYHHFPRPMLALYEMLRVCKKGVVLIEPNDLFILHNFSSVLWLSIKYILHLLSIRKLTKHNFEEVGNYAYTISSREIEKVALGLSLHTVAFKGINDHYIEGIQNEKAEKDSKLFKKIQRIISIRDVLSKINMRPYSILVAIIFKEDPGLEIKHKLKIANYQIAELPRNPYT